jgi:hypothetical protein
MIWFCLSTLLGFWPCVDNPKFNDLDHRKYKKIIVGFGLICQIELPPTSIITNDVGELFLGFL